MKLNLEVFRDKLYACWIGKNIGGTMGTPYEGARQMNDIQGFSTPENVVLPNDDLDLQLVWLLAVERLGINRVNCKTLGEFWTSYITPFWNEYGLGKANMANGILPPLSGDAFNSWKHSNGAWIRTEIWASLAPAAPDVAIRYAYEDAAVDHGTGEGTAAAVFVAALESAAFVESDIRRLIDIGLSKIPESSRLAKSIRLLLDCYEKGMDYRDAREVIRLENSDIGDGWFEAPSNVTYAVLGLLWGEGDFKKSMIYAINCGDDTDCTGATVGSILGIIGGTKAIPADWSAHIGDSIVTVSIRNGSMFKPVVPATCTELTERVLRQTPTVLALSGADVQLVDGESEVSQKELDSLSGYGSASSRIFSQEPYSFTVDFEYASATAILGGDPTIAPLETRVIRVRVENNVFVYGNAPHNIELRWLLPDGFTVKGPKWARLPHRNSHETGSVELTFEITAPEAVSVKNRLVLEISEPTRPTAGYLPVVLMGV